MSKNWIFVDCEAFGPCPGDGLGSLAEFGGVCYKSRESFHGKLFERGDKPDTPEVKALGEMIEPANAVFARFDEWLASVCDGRPIFVSDNPAFDWQWINHGFWSTIGRNPFGHSGRRISDFYAGLVGDFTKTQAWKSFRVTPHDHNPVHDAMGNVEAFARLLAGERP